MFDGSGRLRQVERNKVFSYQCQKLRKIWKTWINLRRSKTKASFFHAFESGPRQRWEVARTILSSANNFSLSCRYPLKTEDHRFGGFLFDWSLHVSLRRAPKNYPSEGNFLEASHVNVDLLVVQILWQENYQNTWNIDKKSTIPSKSQQSKKSLTGGYKSWGLLPEKPLAFK